MQHITPLAVDDSWSTADELAALGWELNTNQYRAVQLAARYDDEFEWFRQGFKSAASAIASRLQLQAATAQEWVRVGHMLRDLPLVNAAFESNELSYAKVRILTRWAEPENEATLLALAETRTANRLTTAIARALAAEEDSDEGRDRRHHEARSFTSYTDGDGMVVIRIVLPPSTAKPIVAAVNELVTRIAKTPFETPDERDRRRVTNQTDQTACRDRNPSADTFGRPSVADTPESATTCGRQPNVTDLGESTAPGDRNLSADTFSRPCVTPSPESTTHCECGCECARSGDEPGFTPPPLAITLAELRERWQPGNEDEWDIPTMAQQRADAFAAFFLRIDLSLTTEVIIHVRGDGNTFDDGTPITTNAVAAQLDQSFIRLMIHDAERRPVNASSRRRHPTARQRRVALEAHNHECVDCAATDLLEFDHNPPYKQTQRTITDELEVRCAPCHRARHRADGSLRSHR